MYSWMPKLCTLRSKCSAAAMHTGRQVGRAVRAGAHAGRARRGGDLAQVGDAAGVHDRGADVVDELLLDQLLAVVDRVEHLADRERRRRVLADQPEALLVLGRRRVLQPEQVVRLERLAEPRRLDRRQAVVHVVQQVQVGPEALAQRARRARGAKSQVRSRSTSASRRAALSRPARRTACRAPTP